MNIAINYLKDVNYKKYIKLCRECEFIVDELGIDKNERWCKAFLSLYEDVKNSYKPQNKSEMKDMIKKKYKKKFDEIDLKFAKKKNNLEFINYILKLKPYPEYEEDKNNKDINFNEDSQDLMLLLQSRYHPDRYDFSDEEESQLNYCLIETIDSYLNKMYENLNK